MRNYAKIAASFWTGATGRALRGDPLAQVVAAYLLSGPGANMIGVYCCPISTIAHDTGSPFEGASEALQRLCEAGFCTYEAESETVFVHQMARYQVAGTLQATDNQVKAVNRLWREIEPAPLKAAFFEAYAEAFHLIPEKPLVRPLQAPPKQEKEKEKEKEYLSLAPLAGKKLNGHSPEPPGFARFWASWPKSDRKGSKGRCLAAWAKGGFEALTDAIVAHVEAMKGSHEWTKNGGEFVPAPLSYLNKRLWEGAELDLDGGPTSTLVGHYV